MYYLTNVCLRPWHVWTCLRRRYLMIVVRSLRGLDSRIYRFVRLMSLVLRHLINSPSNLHGRRQPSNRSDGSLGSKRGGGLHLRRRRSSPSPKGRRGAITHPFSLTYVWEMLSHLYVALPNSTSKHWGTVLKTFHILPLRWVFLGNFRRSEIDPFFFQLRRNSFLVSRGLNSLLVQSHWFLESTLIPRVWEFKICSLWIFAWMEFDLVLARIGHNIHSSLRPNKTERKIIQFAA